MLIELKKVLSQEVKRIVV